MGSPLAATIATGDGLWAAGRGFAVSARVPARVLATDGLAGRGVGGLADRGVPADDEVRLGAADRAGTICKALAGTAVPPAQFMLALGAGSGRSGGQTPRGGSQERSGEQRAPGRAPGSCAAEEAGETIEGLVLHWAVLRHDAEWGNGGNGWRDRKYAVSTVTHERHPDQLRRAGVLLKEEGTCYGI